MTRTRTTRTQQPATRPPLHLPPLDRRLSPHTGFTRAHWEAAADGMLRAAWRWASPRGALLDLPGRASVSGVRSDGLEGYARTFLAAAFRAAGTDAGTGTGRGRTAGEGAGAEEGTGTGGTGPDGLLER